MDCDILVRYIHIIFDARVTSKMATPMFDGSIHFGFCPASDRHVFTGSGGPHKKKRPHQSVVDRPLQSRTLHDLRRILAAIGNLLPPFGNPLERNGPGPICHQWSTLEIRRVERLDALVIILVRNNFYRW